MRLTPKIAAAGAAMLLSLYPTETIAHASLARRHMHHHHDLKHKLRKRAECEFPTDAGLVSVTPEAMNAGWAMSPDQPCKPGMYCPYACPPGMLMGQWDPKATTYAYPQSMNGGLYCNENGEIEKPFPEKPYCYDGVGTFAAVNEAGASVAICQTVLPGNEAMLIPTVVGSSATLAVPDTSYWCKTAAHFYINPPGVSAEEGCIWGTKEKPVGNWTPYVAGANQLDSGETFVKIGWNPIYIEPDVTFRDVVPNWGVRIECDGNCGGLPCEIDPAKHAVNEVSQMKGAGAGGANFCVVSVPKGSTAKLVIFGGDGPTKQPDEDEPKEEEEEKPKPKPKPTPTPTTTKEEPEPEPTTESAESTTEAPTTTEEVKSTSSEESTYTSEPATTTTKRPKLFEAGGRNLGGNLIAVNNTSPKETGSTEMTTLEEIPVESSPPKETTGAASVVPISHLAVLLATAGLLVLAI